MDSPRTTQTLNLSSLTVPEFLALRDDYKASGYAADHPYAVALRANPPKADPPAFAIYSGGALVAKGEEL